MNCQIDQSSMEAWEESIPFDMNTDVSYVYECYFPESDGMPIERLSLWMQKSQSFPLYFCVQVGESFVEMFEETSTQYKIKQYSRKQFNNGYSVVIFEVTNHEQFCGIFPLLKVLSCMDDVVLWSTQKDCFSVGDELKNKLGWIFVPIDIHLQEGHTVYYLPYAGTALTIFSNDITFSTLEKVCSLFPSSIVPI